MRISDWSSDVCSSDLCAKSDKEGEPMMFRFVVAALIACAISNAHAAPPSVAAPATVAATDSAALPGDPARGRKVFFRSEEHTSELQSLMRISYAVFCLKKKKTAHKTKLTIR